MGRLGKNIQFMLGLLNTPIFKAGINLFKVNIGSTTTMCEIYSKIGVFIINFEKISHTILVYPMLILNK